VQIKSALFPHLLSNLAKSTGRYGIYAGFLASALAFPLTGNKNKSSADEPGSKTTTQTTVVVDNRMLEETSASSSYPSIRKGLIKLYQTEEKENKKIKNGEMKETERQVKICFTNFIPPSGIANDGGIDGNLHIVKYIDIKQPDGSNLRTYVNEHWSVIESGILLPETIRIRSQFMKGSLNEIGAENLFKTDLLQLFWEDDANDGGGAKPRLYRQHLFGNFNPTEQINPQNQIEVSISSPTSCISCHRSQATFTQSVFNTEKISFGAITPDSEFQKPYNKQKGYLELIDYLKKLLEANKISPDFMNKVATDLLDSTNLGNPNMANELKSNNFIPWVNGDVLASEYDFRGKDYTYKNSSKTWRKAGFEHFKTQTNVGYWWSRANNVAIPR